MPLTATLGPDGYTMTELGPNMLTAQQVAAVTAQSLAASFPLLKWRKAIGNTLAGISNSRIVSIGDSTSAGYISPSGSLAANAPITVAGRILAKRLCSVNQGAVFGDAMRAGGATFTGYDPRMVTNGAWNTLSGLWTAGGQAFGNSTDLLTLAFTPAESFDTIDVYSIRASGYGTWTVDIDGGAALATVNDNGSTLAIKTTVSCALGTHTVNIKRTGVGGQVFITGIAVRNSASKTVDVYNLAYNGSTAVNWATSNTSYAQLNRIRTMAPNLAVIDVGINDRNTGLYTSAFYTNLSTVVAAAQESGDVLLCVPVPSSSAASAFNTLENQSAFRDAILSVAETMGCAIYDKSARLVSYTAANAAGYYSDTLHLTAPGYAAIGIDLSVLCSGL